MFIEVILFQITQNYYTVCPCYLKFGYVDSQSPISWSKIVGYNHCSFQLNLSQITQIFWVKIIDSGSKLVISVCSHYQLLRDCQTYLGCKAKTEIMYLEALTLEVDIRTITQTSSVKRMSQKSRTLITRSPNFAEMILGWSPSKIVSVISDLRPRWPPQPNLI